MSVILILERGYEQVLQMGDNYRYPKMLSSQKISQENGGTFVTKS